MRERSPFQPTAIERFVDLGDRLPYAWGCLFWALFFGFAGPLVAGYVDTADIRAAVVNMLGPSIPLPQAVVNFALNSVVLLFLLMYFVRFMRTKLMRSQRELARVLPKGESSLHEMFGGVSSALPPVLIGAGLTGLYLLPGGSASPSPKIIDLRGLFELASSIFSALALGTFLWVYFSSLRGLDKLGRGDLNLMPSSVDPMLGLRPLGSISLSLAFSYFVVVALGALPLVILPLGFSVIALLAIFVVVGVVMFFLPLNSAHRRMRQTKSSEKAQVRTQFNELLRISNDGVGAPPGEDAGQVLARIEKLLTIQMQDKKVSEAPTWPFDTSTLGRFVAIILSVVVSLTARLIATVLLHL